MMIGAVDQHDVDRGMGQTASRVQSAKPAADNDDAWTRVRSGARHRITLTAHRRSLPPPQLRIAMIPPDDGPAAGTEPNAAPHAQRQFRRTLVRVMAMQIGALLVLWWLQHRYTS